MAFEMLKAVQQEEEEAQRLIAEAKITAENLRKEAEAKGVELKKAAEQRALAAKAMIEKAAEERAQAEIEGLRKKFDAEKDEIARLVAIHMDEAVNLLMKKVVTSGWPSKK